MSSTPSSAGAPATPASSGPRPPVDHEIGWARAVASGLAILLVGFGAAVGANRILTKALALRRTSREWLATALVFLVIVVLAFVLRRLQDRKLI